MPTVETNGIRTYYERRGEGRPVVFVHGATVDHHAWAPQFEAVAAERDAVAYDVRGHGRTGASSRRAYSIDLMAADLRALVDALDLDRPVVCGTSMGGLIAQTYAARNPESLSGLVLADTFTPPILTRREWVQRKLLLRATTVPVRLFGHEPVERTVQWLQDRLQGRGDAGAHERVRRLRSDAPRMTADEFAKVMRAVAAFDETPVDLEAIDVPALVCYGEHELPLFREHAARLAATLPRVTVREVPDAGHAANVDNPEFFTDVLRSFLGRVFD